MTAAPLLDLDAARREAAYPDGIPVVKGGQTFTLPAELPVEVFDPFLSENLGLVDILKDALSEKADDKGLGELVIDTLLARPSLPADLLQAIKDAFAVLFDEQYPAFVATRPSVQDYVRLTRGLVQAYGVSLGEATASPGSSESAGATPKPTSTSTTDSTPEASGDTPEAAAS